MPRPLGCCAAALVTITGCALTGLPTTPPPRQASTPEQALIERQPVCVGSLVRSAGKLGSALYYHYLWSNDGKLVVGYYAFYADERPWGDNWMTWLFLPALAIDLVYTRSFFLGPGYRQLAHGKGDVEGFRIIYDFDGKNELTIDHAIADDSLHRERRLEPSELFRLDPTQPTLYSASWSHQLGGRGARSVGDLATRHCFRGESLRPITHSIAQEFNLDRRARPASIAAMAGPAGPRDLVRRLPTAVGDSM
jgi:hypothetical protein